jgi:hypothetical protein
MSSCIKEGEFALPSTYIGIENEDEKSGSTVCLEFDVSFKIFILALILSKLEITCNDEDEKA